MRYKSFNVLRKAGEFVRPAVAVISALGVLGLSGCGSQEPHPKGPETFARAVEDAGLHWVHSEISSTPQGPVRYGISGAEARTELPDGEEVEVTISGKLTNHGKLPAQGKINEIEVSVFPAGTDLDNLNAVAADVFTVFPCAPDFTRNAANCSSDSATSNASYVGISAPSYVKQPSEGNPYSYYAILTDELQTTEYFSSGSTKTYNNPLLAATVALAVENEALRTVVAASNDTNLPSLPEIKFNESAPHLETL